MNLLRTFLEQVLGLLAALLLFMMMMLTFVDVIGRYLFNSPVPGGFELTEMMLATLIFLGLPLVTADQGHVSVDLFDTLVPKTIQPYQMALVDIVGAVAMGVMAWRLWLFADRIYGYGDTTAMLEIPYAPLVYLMAVMSTLATLVLLGLIFAHAQGMMTPPSERIDYE